MSEEEEGAVVGVPADTAQDQIQDDEQAFQKIRDALQNADTTVENSKLTAAEKKAVHTELATVAGIAQQEQANDVAFLAEAPPAAPTGLKLTPDNGSLHATWTAPASSEPITSYELWIVGETSPAVTTASTSATIPNLLNGTTYMVTVAATNASGTSVASAPASGTPTAPASLPGAPTNVSVTPGNGELIVAWDAPANDGGEPIEDYEVSAVAQS